jgi:ABC-type antimicrobial peptide transport system permease subunit
VALVARVAGHGGVPMKMPGGGGVFVIVPALTPALAVAALVLCTLGGLAGAVYPALRAARLRPVEALRSL